MSPKSKVSVAGKMKPFDLDNEKYHLGHLFIDVVRRSPDAINQIDAATGESETNASVLRRSIQLARCLLRYGVQPGDILALGGRNHLDLHIPYYAGVMIGMSMCGVDRTYKYHEIKDQFKIISPRIAFCQKELLKDTLKAIKDLGLNTELLCFDDGDCYWKRFIEKYGDMTDIENFEPLDFDLDTVYAALSSTGGTTGIMKFAAFKHMTIINKLRWLDDTLRMTNHRDILFKMCGEYRPSVHLTPVQWFSGFFNPVSFPLMHYTMLTTSAPLTAESLIDMINRYKPVSYCSMPSFRAVALLNSKQNCDYTCFDNITFTGTKMSKKIIRELRKRMRPDAKVKETYGMTEAVGSLLIPNPDGPIGNCGKCPANLVQLKLVDSDSGKEITKPYMQGEAWIKGSLFSEYYNNPQETAKSFSEDGWYKTGDVLYKDEEGNCYFVERLKTMIVYRYYRVLSSEIEAVIREHPAVQDVIVTSIPDTKDGDLAVACVVRKNGDNITAQEIIDLVASKLPEVYRLHGGVVFVSKIPLTSTGKIARAKLQKMVMSINREYREMA